MLKQLACKELQTWTYLDLHIKHKQGRADIYEKYLFREDKVGGIVGLLWTHKPKKKKKSKSIYFPLLIRMPQGAKLAIFLNYLYSRKNKLIKTWKCEKSAESEV